MLAAPLWTAAAFVAQPRHHQPVPALRHRVARPVAVSVDDAMPTIALGVGSLAAAAWALNGRPTGLTSPTPGAPAPTAPLSVPEPELLTPEGQRLCRMLAARPAEFSDSWSALLRVPLLRSALDFENKRTFFFSQLRKRRPQRSHSRRSMHIQVPTLTLTL